MTPERLQFIKERLTKHQSAPDAVELALELCAAMEPFTGTPVVPAAHVETMEADLRRVASGFVEPNTTYTGVVGEVQKAMDEARNQLVAAREELAEAKKQLAEAPHVPKKSTSHR